MEKSLVLLSILRLLVLRQHRLEFQTDQDRVFHLVLCASRMNVASMDRDFHGCRVKGLILHLAPGAAVNSVSHICAPAGNIKEVNAVSDFLVRCESDLDGSVRDLRVCQKCLRHGHDLGNSRLVICT